MKQRYFIVLFLFFLVLNKLTYSVVKGSDLLVSVENFFTFPASDVGNKIATFGCMKNGFALEDSLTTCTFDSVYPVSGTIDLKGGLLYLSKPLVFQDPVTLTNLGRISSSNSSMSMSSNSSSTPSDPTEVDSTQIIINNDLTITSTMIFTGKVEIYGSGHTVTLGPDAVLTVSPNSQLRLKNMRLLGVETGKFFFEDDTASLVLDDMAWHQSDNFIFGTGSMLVCNDVEMVGSYTFFYSSAYTSTIERFSQLAITDDMYFSIGRKHPDNGVEPLHFVDESSVLNLDNCSLIITDSGILFKKGRIVLDHSVNVDINSTSTMNGLIFGSGIASDDFIVNYNAGATAKLNKGHITYNNSVSDGIKSLSKKVRIVRDVNSHIYVAKDLVLPAMVLEVLSESVPPMQIESGATLDYDNSTIILPNVQFDITGNQLGAYTYNLNGDDEFFLTKGILPLFLNVQNTNNVLHGNGGISNIVTLQDENAVLNCNINGTLSNNVLLNDGLFNLKGNLRLEEEGFFVGSGTIDIDSYFVHLFSKPLNYNTSLFWTGSSGVIEINSLLSLSSTWTFDGNCVIEGNSNTISLKENGELVIADGATLEIHNARLLGINDNNIRCLGDNSNLLLVDVEWVQNGDYTFKNGSISFAKHVDFLGSHTFLYDSSQTSTLHNNSTLRISDNMNFSLGRKSDNNFVEPLHFSDKTSVLNLDNCTLNITSTGVQFTRGTIECTRDIAIDIHSTSTVNGMILGDGTSQGDMTFEFDPGSSVRFNSGHVLYDVTTNDGFKSRSKTARLYRNSGTYFYINQNLVISDISMYADSLAVLDVVLGKTLSYSDGIIVLDNGTFEITGSRYNFYTNLLAGNQSIFMHSGFLPAYTLVVGTGNTIHGNGLVTGGVILSDSNTEIIFGLDGVLLNSVTMNGGTVKLMCDLACGRGVSFSGNGTVDLADNNLVFGSQNLTWVTDLYWGATDGSVHLNADVGLSSAWTFSGVCTLDGHGKILDLGSTGNIIVENGSKLILKDIILEHVGDNNIRCLDDAGVIVFDNVRWLQDSTYTFSSGSMQYLNETMCSGPYSFIYDSLKTSTVCANAELLITNGLKFSIGKKSNGENPLDFIDQTSVLHFNNSTFDISSGGLHCKKGTVACSRDVIIDINSTSTVNGLVLGSGQVADDMVFEMYPGTTVNFNSGHVLYDITSGNGLKSRSDTSKISRAANTCFYINQNLTISSMSMYADPLAVLDVAAGKALSYSDGRLILDDGVAIITGSRYNSFMNLLAGNHTIFLEGGILPAYTFIMGTNNKINGSGGITGGIILSDSTAELQWGVNGVLLNNITMAGGMLNLLCDITLGRGNVLSGNGVVKLGNLNFNIGTQETTWTDDLYWDGTGGSINLNGDIALSGKWTFSGNSVIEGKGHVLDLGTTGSIIVDQGSCLHIKNTHLKNIHGYNIRCLDNASILTLDNDEWLQDSSYTFSMGALRFFNSVHMKGEDTIFAYETIQTSTITKNTVLKLDTKFTFSYTPLISQSPDALEFEDSSSTLLLNSASLYVTCTGLKLTKGTLSVNEESTLAAEVTYNEDSEILEGGITIGDGVSQNDMVCVIDIGSKLILEQGRMIYNNVNTSSIKMVNQLSQLRLLQDTQIDLLQDIVLDPGVLLLNETANIVSFNNKKIFGSVLYG